MAFYIPEQDPYRLVELTASSSGRPIHEMDGTFHTIPTADRGTLLLWTSRPRLTDELYTHVENALQLPRSHKNFPTASDLSMPAFHAMVEAPFYSSPDGNGRIAGEQWQHMHSPDELVKNIRLDIGIEIPASTLSQLDADLTLAWYGNLHVDHIDAVFQMEAVRRDRAFLDHDPDSGVLSGRRAALDNYADALRHDLGKRLRDTESRGARPDQLIVGQTSEWTEQARIAELRTWPGGAATQKVIADFDRAAADWHSIVEKPWTILPHQSESDLFAGYDNRKHTFLSDMSRARTQEWADAAKPATLTPHRLLPATELTEADLRRRATQQHSVDRGIRHEPTSQAQHQQLPRRIENLPSHTMEHRRPSI